MQLCTYTPQLSPLATSIVPSQQHPFPLRLWMRMCSLSTQYINSSCKHNHDILKEFESVERHAILQCGDFFALRTATVLGGLKRSACNMPCESRNLNRRLARGGGLGLALCSHETRIWLSMVSAANQSLWLECFPKGTKIVKACMVGGKRQGKAFESLEMLVFNALYIMPPVCSLFFLTRKILYNNQLTCI